MDLLLDLLTGLGLALSCGLSPFLPVLVAGALAAADVGLDFDGTAFSFLEEPAGLLVVALLVIAALVVRMRRSAFAPQVAALGISAGAILFAATLDDGQDVWWYGLPLGALAALGALIVSRTLLERVSDRFVRTGDSAAAGALPLYAEGTGLLGSALSALLPPVSLLLAGFLGALGWRQRAQAERKYAGLRILR